MFVLLYTIKFSSPHTLVVFLFRAFCGVMESKITIISTKQCSKSVQSMLQVPNIHLNNTIISFSSSSMCPLSI